MGAAINGRIYYVLSSESIDTGAQMYSYDPATDKIQHLGDLTEAAGEKGLKAVPQGKSHVNFTEHNGKLYFATHVGYYLVENGVEKFGVPPAGYKPYPGGHFLSYDLATGKFEELGKAPNAEGILTMAMDTRRLRLYGLTWPSGHFLRCDLETKRVEDLGPVSRKGEAGSGQEYRTLCRSFTVDPQDGSVYFTTADGTIMRYRYQPNAIETVAGEDMKKDYFGLYDPTSPGHMGYNWRQTVWYEPEKVIYGVHGNSGYLFRLDLRKPRLDIVERITSEPSRRSGMFDKFYYGYLGFSLGPDGRTLYYLTGGAIYEDGKLVRRGVREAVGARGEENLHLVTYDIPARQYTDHGPVFYQDGQRPSYVNSVAVGKDGTVYTLARITEKGHTRADLVSITTSQIRTGAGGSAGR
jgi:hypothetical protein